MADLGEPGPGSVLVVDSDPEVRKAIVGMLAPALRVVQTSTGAEGLQVIRRGERFVAILCDVKLPDYGGFAWREALAAIAPGQAARTIFTSTFAQGWEVGELARREPHRVLIKPLVAEAVRAAIEDARRLAPP